MSLKKHDNEGRWLLFMTEKHRLAPVASTHGGGNELLMTVVKSRRRRKGRTGRRGRTGELLWLCCGFNSV